MLGKGEEQREDKRFGAVLTLIHSILIVILIILVVIMMIQINIMQGTARVINYTGLVRGATQRLIKLELTQNPSDELIGYLDDILTDLKYEGGSYGLVSLEDDSYQEKLDNLRIYWDNLKNQISNARTNDYDPENMQKLLEMSEVYFKLADETVFAAEIYSDKIARQIRVIELISAVDMCILFGIMVEQTLSAMKMRRKNAVLEKKAYIDVHTGLQNKNMCEELIRNKDCITQPTACIVFDINNLKQTNDTLGHLVGDKLIADFAGRIRSVVPEGDFAGRYGGDEFMIVLYGITDGAVDRLLAELQDKVDDYNSFGDKVPISYAYGWAVSTDYKNCTFKTLFNEADHCMYVNKQKMKREIGC